MKGLSCRGILYGIGFCLLVAGTFCPRLNALDPKTALKDYRISSWAVTDGLPYPAVAALAQSRDGYLWIATRVGLGRFDGVTFTTFTPKEQPQLPSERITALCAAPDGTLWIGTAKGVTYYRDGEWSRPKAAKSIDDTEITAFFPDAEGSMLVATLAKVFRVKADLCTEVPVLGPQSTINRVNAIARDARGDLILGGRGLFRETPAGQQEISADLGLSKPWIAAVGTSAPDTLWVGTLLGLIAWNRKEFHTFTSTDGLPSNAVRSLLADSDGNVWVGTSNGLARFGNGRFHALLIHGVEAMSHVLCLYEDRERNLWVGTDNGLHRVQDVKVANLTQRDGLPINATLCVLQAKDGTRWVGTYGGGLAHIMADRIQTYRIADGLAEDGVGALAEDNEGALWIGYYTRAMGRLKNGKITNYTPSSRATRISGLGVDRQGTVWANDGKGLYRFVDGNFESIAAEASLGTVCPLHIDSTGGIWLAGTGGAGRYFEGRWTVYPAPKSPALQNVQCIFSDTEGDIWILHDGPSLARIHDGQRREFPCPVEWGPLSYHGFGYKDELWINFRAGVARIPLTEIAAVISGAKVVPAYVLYNEADGMRSRAPNVAGSPGAAPMNDGSLWFATSAGVAIIDPARIRTNGLPPNVVIEHVFADKKEFAIPDLAHVPPGRGELAFQFTALSLVKPSLIRFKYRLRGFDADWTEASPGREAHYGGLPSGAYRFEVIACNNEGIWNTTGAACSIVLLPHFYERWWFFGAVGLMLSGAAAGTYKWRSRHLKRRAEALQRQNEELERCIAARTAELRESYDALRASEYFYHSLVESLPQVIARKDAAGRYTYVNAAFGQLIDRPLAAILGHTDEELLPAEAAAKTKTDEQRILELRQPMEFEEIRERTGGKRLYLHVKKFPLFDDQGQTLGIQTLFWDMTVFRETEEKLKTAQRELVEISRLAGIAEMATGVLHNLGNALNSVKVSAGVALRKMHQLNPSRVGRVGQLLTEEKSRLADFLTTDERGAKIPSYLVLLGTELERECGAAMQEMKTVADGIEHIAQIVAAQQDHARVTGIIEEVSPSELLEYACRMNEASLTRHGVSVTREYMPTPSVRVQRQKALQVLVNLVRNATESLTESGRPDKRLTLRVQLSATGLVLLSVADNGVGIAPELISRVFEFGFTTKKKGHGFGLHSSALAAREMDGSLRVQSDGPGKGAICTLELPAVA